MINWFGASWSAPVCDTTPHVDTPVGALCVRCQVPIAEGDQGITMPALASAPGDPAVVAYHRLCHLKSCLPHAHWEEVGLVPDETDGLVDGFFHCKTCGVCFHARSGGGGTWQRG